MILVIQISLNHRMKYSNNPDSRSISLKSSITSQMSKSSAMTMIDGEGLFFSQWKDQFFFPMISEMVRQLSISPSLNTVLTIYSFLQNYGILFTLSSRRIWPNMPKELKILYCFTNWGISFDKFNKCLPQYIICFCIPLIIICMMVYLYSFYSMNHSFHSWHLHFTSITYSIVSRAFFPTIASISAQSFIELTKNSSGFTISFFITSLIFLIIIFLFLKLFQKSVSNSPVLSQLWYAWDSECFFADFFYKFYISFVIPILDLFPAWMTWSYLPITILFIAKQTYSLYFLPFFTIRANVFVSTKCVLLIACQICSLIWHFMPKMNIWLFLSIPIITCIIACFPLHFLFRKRVRKISSKLSKESLGVEPPYHDREVRSYFETLVFSSVRDLVCYLRVGCMEQCDFFIDFSFQRYIMESYMMKDVLFPMLQLTALFPQQLDFLTYCLKLSSMLRDLSIEEQYFIYQTRRIQILRQSSIQKDELQKLQKQSSITISNVRTFWSEILNAKTKISPASFRAIRMMTIETESMFLNAIEKYPNNHSILEEFVNFLVEGSGNYSSAVHWKRKSNMLELGKQIVIDYAFKSLVNVYPNYLTDHILDIHGHLLSKGDSSTTNNSSNNSGEGSSDSFSDSNDTSSLSDADDYRFDQTINTLFDHGKLRIKFAHLLNSSRPKFFNFITLGIIIEFLVILLIFSLIMVYLPRATKSDLVYPNLIQKVSWMSDAIGYSGIINSIKYLTDPSINKFGGLDIISEYLFINENDYPSSSILKSGSSCLSSTISSLSLHFMQFLYFLQEHLTSDLIELYYSFSQNKKCHYTSIIVDIGSSTPTVNDMVQFQEESYFSTRTMISAFYYSINRILTYGPTPQNIINTFSLLNSLSELSDSIYEIGLSSMQSLHSFVDIIMYSIASVFFFFSISFWIYQLYSMTKHFTDYSEILKFVDKATVEKSYQPISLHSNVKTIRGSTSTSVHQSDWVIPALGTMIIFSVFLYTGLIILPYNAHSPNYSDINEIFSWSYLSSNEFSSLLKSILILVMNSTMPDLAASILIDPITGQVPSATEKSVGENQILMHYKYGRNLTLRILTSTINSQNKLNLHSRFLQQSTTTPQSYQEGLSYDSLEQRTQIAAIDAALTVFSLRFPNNVLDHYGNGTTIFNTYEFAELFYLLDTHLFTELFDFQHAISNFIDDFYSYSSSRIYIVFIIAIIVSFIIVIICIILLHMLYQSYQGIIQLLILLPPENLLSNNRIISFLFKSNDDENYTHSIPELILFKNSYSIITLKADDLVIQSINTSLQKMTGFTPDQLLGQPIVWLIPQNNSKANKNNFHKTGFLNTNNKSNLRINITQANRNAFGNQSQMIYNHSQKGQIQKFQGLVNNQIQSNQRPSVNSTKSSNNISKLKNESLTTRPDIKNLDNEVKKSSNKNNISCSSATDSDDNIQSNLEIGKESSEPKYNIDLISQKPASFELFSDIEGGFRELEDHSDDFYSKLSSVIDGNEKLATVNVNIDSESGKEISTKTTIIGHSDANGNVDSLTLFLIDTSAAQKQKNESLELMQRLENMVKSLLPYQNMFYRGLHLNLLGTTLRVQIAPVAFIKIIGFSQYIKADQQPKQLLQDMDRVYAALINESKTMKDSLIIRQSDGVFIIASGMIDSSSPLAPDTFYQTDEAIEMKKKESSLVEIVEFCLNIRMKIGNLSEQLIMPITLKSAIVLSGPWVAGVLSENSPEFCLFGKGVNEGEQMLTQTRDATVTLNKEAESIIKQRQDFVVSKNDNELPFVERKEEHFSSNSF